MFDGLRGKERVLRGEGENENERQRRLRGQSEKPSLLLFIARGIYDL